MILILLFILFMLFILFSYNIDNFDDTNIAENIIEQFFKKLDYQIYIYGGSCESYNELNKVIKESDSTKKYLIFFTNDYNDNIDIPDNFIVYRSGLYKTKKKYNEFVFPILYCNSLDIKPLNPVLKTSKPKISFTGNYGSYDLREKWINDLQNSDKLECYFINTHYFKGGGIEQLISYYNKSEFCFCPRGTGNFSIRFYETLYYGRIPVIIDTDIILPFENIIEWNKYIVIGKTIDELIVNIIHFWENNDIIEAQQNARKIYDKYFSQENINNTLLQEINNFNLTKK